jgi:hypothetical protein
MADVLVVATLQFGYPIPVLVLTERDDFAFGHGGDSLAVLRIHLAVSCLNREKRCPCELPSELGQAM